MPNLRDLGPTSGLFTNPAKEQTSNLEILQATQGYTPSIADRVGANQDFERGLQSGGFGMKAGELHRAADYAERDGDMESSKRLRDQAVAFEQDAASVAPRVGSTADVNGFGDAIDFAQSGLGQLAPTMAATTLPAIAGAIVGGVLTGGNPLGAMAGASLAGGYSGFQMEAGEAASNQQSDAFVRGLDVNQRIREQNIKGAEAAAVELLFPAMVGGRLAGNVAKIFGKAAAKQVEGTAAKAAERLTLRQHLGGAAKTIGKETSVEGLTEATQTMIGQASMSRLNPNRDTSNDWREIIDATILGALGGGGMSLSTTVPGALIGASKDGALRPLDPMLEYAKNQTRRAKDKALELGGQVADKTAPARKKASELTEAAIEGGKVGIEKAKTKIKDADLANKATAVVATAEAVARKKAKELKAKATPVVEAAVEKADELAKKGAVIAENKIERGKQKISDANLGEKAKSLAGTTLEKSKEAAGKLKELYAEHKPTDEQQVEAKRKGLAAWRKAQVELRKAGKLTGEAAQAALAKAQEHLDTAQTSLEVQGGAVAVAKKGAQALRDAGKKMKNEPEAAVADAVNEVSSRLEKLKAGIDSKIADGSADESLKKVGEAIGKMTKTQKDKVTAKYLKVQEEIAARKRTRKSLLGATGDDAILTEDDMLHMAIEEAAADEDFVESSTKYRATAEEITGLRPLEPASGQEQAGQRTALRLHEPMYTTEQSGRKPFIKIRGADIRNFLQEQVRRGVITQEVMNSAQVEPLGEHLQRKGASQQEMENELGGIVRDLVRRAQTTKDPQVRKAIESELAQLPIDVTRGGMTQVDSASEVMRKNEHEMKRDQKAADKQSPKRVPSKDRGKLFPETDKQTFPIKVSEFKKHHFGFAIDIAPKQGELALGPTRKEADARQGDLFPNTLGDQYKLPSRQEAVTRALNKYGIPLVSDAAAGASALSPQAAKQQRRGLDVSTQDKRVPESEKIKLKLKNGQNRVVHLPSLIVSELNANREEVEGNSRGKIDQLATASAIAAQLMDNDVVGVVGKDAQNNDKIQTGMAGIRSWLKKQRATGKMSKEDAAGILRALTNRQRNALGQKGIIGEKDATIRSMAARRLQQIQRSFKKAKAAALEIDSPTERAAKIKELRAKNSEIRDNLSLSIDLNKKVKEIVDNMDATETTVIGEELDNSTAYRLAEIREVPVEQVLADHKQLITDMKAGKVKQGKPKAEIIKQLRDGLAPNQEIRSMMEMAPIEQRAERALADRYSALAQDLQEIQNEAVRDGTQLQEQTRGRRTEITPPSKEAAEENSFLAKLTTGKVLGAKGKAKDMLVLDSRMRNALAEANMRKAEDKAKIVALAKEILLERRNQKAVIGAGSKRRVVAANITTGEDTVGESNVAGENIVTQARPKSQLAADMDFDRKGKKLGIRHAEDQTGGGRQVGVGQGGRKATPFTTRQLKENRAYTKRIVQLARKQVRNLAQNYFKPNAWGTQAAVVTMGKTAQKEGPSLAIPQTSVANATGRQVGLLVAPKDAADVVESVEFHQLLATASAIELLAPNALIEQELKDASFKRVGNSKVWVPVMGTESTTRNSLAGNPLGLLQDNMDPASIMDAVEKSVGPKLATKIQFVFNHMFEQMELRRGIPIKQSGRLMGRYYGTSGNIELLIENFDSYEEAVFTAWHELFHKGFDNLYDNVYTIESEEVPAQFIAMQKTLQEADKNPTVAKIADWMVNKLKMNRPVAVEEALVELGAAMETGDYAYIQEKYGVAVPPGIKTGLQSIVQKFLAIVRSIIGDKAMSDRDVFQLLGKMRQNMEADPINTVPFGEYYGRRESRDFTKDGESEATMEGINRFVKATLAERTVQQMNNMIDRRRMILKEGVKSKAMRAALMEEIKLLTREVDSRSPYERFSQAGASVELNEALSTEDRTARKNKVIEFLLKRLGPELQILFPSIEQLNGTGSFDWHSKTIRLAVEQAGYMGAAAHEAFHAFFHAMGKVDSQRRVYNKLLAAANAPHIKRQLRALLKDEPAALAQLNDPEERLAYMYQFYNSKELKLRGPIREWFKTTTMKLGKLIGYVTKMDAAEQIFKAFDDGKMKDYYSIRAKLSAVQNVGLAKSMENAYVPVKEAMKAVLQSATDRLRNTNNMALREIADLFYRDPKTGGPTGFLANRAQREATFRNQLKNIFAAREIKPNDPRLTKALAELQGQVATADLSPLARELRGFLREMFTYLREDAGVMKMSRDADGNEEWTLINDEGELYFPRRWDSSSILANWDEFAAQVRRDEPNLPEEDLLSFKAALEYGEQEPGAPMAPDFNPSMGAVESRTFNFIRPENAANYAKWQNQDLIEIMTTYVRQAAHRGENTKSFGPKDDKLQELLQQAKDEGATKEQLEIANKAIKALKGTLGTEKMTPMKRNAMAVAMTVVNFAVLPLALFSSLVDPLGVMVRTGSVKGAGDTFIEGLKQIGRDIAGNPSQKEKMAEMLGIIEEEQMLTIIGDSYHGMFMNSTLKKLNDTFFKAIGLDSWTKGTRIGAMTASMLYLRDNATNAKALKELGLKEGDIVMERARDNRGRLVAGSPTVVVFDPAKLPGGREQAQRVRSAINRMVDESILRPTAAQRPIFMSDARFQLLGHLKQFTFSFHNTIVKQVRDNVRGELNNQEYVKAAQGLLPLLSYVPFMIAADMTRMLVAGRWDDDDDRELPQYIWDAVQRSAILGYGTFAMDSVDDISYGGLPINTFLGPVIDKGIRLTESAIDPDERFVNEARRLLPGYALWKGYME